MCCLCSGRLNVKNDIFSLEQQGTLVTYVINWIILCCVFHQSYELKEESALSSSISTLWRKLNHPFQPKVPHQDHGRTKFLSHCFSRDKLHLWDKKLKYFSLAYIYTHTHTAMSYFTVKTPRRIHTLTCQLIRTKSCIPDWLLLLQ